MTFNKKFFLRDVSLIYCTVWAETSLGLFFHNGSIDQQTLAYCNVGEIDSEIHRTQIVNTQMGTMFKRNLLSNVYLVFSSRLFKY